MVIQMIKQSNPDNPFYIPYLQPVKMQIQEALKKGEIKKIDLESFVLPKEATIYTDEQGIEAIYVNGQKVRVMAEIPSGLVYLLNAEILLQVDRFIPNKNERIVLFPKSLNKAV
jgi:hypothetical protein